MTGTVFLESSELSIGETDGTVLVAILRTGDLSGQAIVNYGVTENTATIGEDFVGGSGQVVMQPGQSRILIPVQIVDNTAPEPTETFTFSIVSVDPSSTLLFPRTSRINILDNENPISDPVDPPLSPVFNVTEQPIITGLTQPLAFEFNRLDPSLVYISEKAGRIRIFDLDTGTFRPDLIDLTAKVNNIQDRGLIDIALHPDLAAHPYIYAFYVVDPPDVTGTGNAGADGAGNRFAHVVRFTLDAGYTSIVPGSEVILLGGAGRTLQDISGGGAIDSTDNLGLAESGFDAQSGQYLDDYIKVDSRSHAGGSLAFGPDGALYISIGDGTSFNAADPRSVSVQNLDSLSGKILRVDPLTGDGLPNNPFVELGDSLDANRSKVYQLGLRNPFSIGFDQNGRLLISNTGWDSWEEIESGPAGANFGWPYFEGGDNGTLLRTPGYSSLPSAAAFYAAVASGDLTITPAFRAFAHASAEPGFQIQAITAGDVAYSGSRYPVELQNSFFFADIVDGEVFIVDVNDRRDVDFLYSTTKGPVHFSQGPDGYVYYASLFNGEIGRLLIESPSPGSLLTRGSASFDLASNTYTLATGFGEAGIVTSSGRIDVRQAFTISFDAYVGSNDADGADGVAFVLHNDPAGFNAIGAPGSGLAIGGINNGLAFELDTYASSAGDIISGGPDIANDHADFLDTDGPFATMPFDLGNLENGQWHSVSLSWNPATTSLTATVDGGQVATLNDNVVATFLGGSNFAYFGVGAGTGGLTNDHKVRFTGVQATFEGQGGPQPGAPVANADSAATSASVAIDINVLANDSDPDGDQPAITGVTSTTGIAGRSDLGALVSMTGSGSNQRVNYNGIAATQLITLAAGATAIDHFAYTITDTAGHTAGAAVTVTVTGVNDPPTITSNGGGDTAAISLAENTAAVTTVSSNDPDSGTTRTYSIAGGADAARFSMNASTGTLTFVVPPDFEAPADVGGDNVYNVTIMVSDGAGASDSQVVAVTVTNAGGISPPASDAATITGTPEDDVLTGLGGNNALNGLDGDDTLSGGGGTDTLNGGNGNDTMRGGPGNDTVNGGAGSDKIVYAFGDGADVVDGGTGTDTLQILGTSAADTLDVIYNGTNLTGFESGTLTGVETVTADLLGGSDRLSYTGSTAAVTVNLATSAASGFSSIASIEYVTGGSGIDTLIGNTLANSLNGGSGADRITGGVGNDALNGGNGTDTFVFAPGFGSDTINGFDANPSGGQDLLEFAGGITAASITVSDVGADTLVTVGADSIRLIGIGNASNVTTDDFRFVA